MDFLGGYGSDDDASDGETLAPPTNLLQSNGKQGKS